ncbi:hypothetical protein NVP1291O_68 [Vibrio phage 1.291.O._10N.286.55.F6]|nr:hypothetical protein NVP1291O_68 [Vibrio phage 1.291.O._10N.286.55.F6]
MNTYKTYQEAKIANPESDIFTKAGKFIGECDLGPSPHTYECRGIAKCNPADYCMTVEEFLGDGYKFVEGDICLGQNDNFLVISGSRLVNGWNDESQIVDGIDRYVLRAAALEERANLESAIESVARSQFDEIVKVTPAYSKPRTKGGYVKCGFNSRGAALDCFDNNEELYEPSCNPEGYSLCEDPCSVIDMWDQLYRRIETPMTERDELLEALQSVWIIDGVDGQEQLEKIVDSGLFKLVNHDSNRLRNKIRSVAEWEMNTSNNHDWESVAESIYCAVDDLLKS